jgi:hypothetical protein
MATNAQKGNPLTEFATTIPLFQGKRQLTFNGSTNSEQRYRADFVLDGFDLKGTVILSSRLNEFEKSFINEKKSAPLTLFSKMNLYLNKMPAKPRTQPARYILELEYSKDNLDLEQVPGTSFRNWPEDMVVSLWKQELFQGSDKIDLSRKQGNTAFVEILETLDWPIRPNGLIDSSSFKPGELDRIFYSMLTVFETTRKKIPFFSDFVKNVWNMNDSAIPTDVPVKTLASFCLTTGRFPNLGEVNMLRGNIKERVRD